MLLVTMQGCKEALEERGLVVVATAGPAHGSLRKLLYRLREPLLVVEVGAAPVQLIMGKMVNLMR